jgi:CRISPR-associated exonuclease Cas4
MDDGLLIPVSALQHVLFCERQFSLIHVERMWSENRFTAEGRILHERVHAEHHESRRTVRQEFGFAIRSTTYGLIGICDLVEIQLQDRKTPVCITPVEFKRGKTKETDVDLVQLCAQAICLQEMFEMDVPCGQIYYLQEHRRKTIEIDDPLVSQTLILVERCRSLMAGEETPKAVYEPKKCNACSLFDLCGPKHFGAGGKQVSRYVQNQTRIIQTENPA